MGTCEFCEIMFYSRKGDEAIAVFVNYQRRLETSLLFSRSMREPGTVPEQGRHGQVDNVHKVHFRRGTAGILVSCPERKDASRYREFLE